MDYGQIDGGARSSTNSIKFFPFFWALSTEKMKKMLCLLSLSINIYIYIYIFIWKLFYLSTNQMIFIFILKDKFLKIETQNSYQT